jgi:hypothetical protein
MKTFSVKAKDGRDEKIYFEDFGLALPIYSPDVNSAGAAYSTMFFARGRMILSQTDKWLADRAGDLEAFRKAEDLASIEGLCQETGLDPNTLVLDPETESEPEDYGEDGRFG